MIGQEEEPPQQLQGNIFTLELQIEDTARKNLTRIKKSIRFIFIYRLSLQNDRFQLPLCLGLTAVTLAQKLIPFLKRVDFF